LVQHVNSKISVVGIHCMSMILAKPNAIRMMLPLLAC